MLTSEVQILQWTFCSECVI